VLGVGRLAADIHGSEYDEFQVLAFECGALSAGDLDDNATRALVWRFSSAQLAALPAHVLAQLIRILIAGSCGDDDERSIIRIMESVPCSRRKEIMAHPGATFGDIDPNVPGAEWDTLEPLLRC
jgi:hypothetical protein